MRRTARRHGGPREPVAGDAAFGGDVRQRAAAGK